MTDVTEIIALQEQAAISAMFSIGCREQAKQAAKDGFNPREWLDDAIHYQRSSAVLSAVSRKMMGIEHG